MSSQGGQKLRRNGSPSTKQGPMRATQQFGLVHTSPTCCAGRKCSPPTSPTTVGGSCENYSKNRPSSETRISYDWRSTTSACGSKVEKNQKPIQPSHCAEQIKRTGSLDTIVGPYLSGQWPRDAVPHLPPQPVDLCMCDKHTQTPEEWEDLDSRRKKVMHARSHSLGNGDQLILIKHRLQRTKDTSKQSGVGGQRQSPVHANHTSFVSIPHSMPIKIPAQSHVQKLRIRGSVEGLNQEVEKLIISGSRKDLEKALDKAAEGRRAPIAELLGSSAPRSVNTQTPIAIDEGRGSKNSSGTGSRSQSVSPLLSTPGQLDLSLADMIEEQDDKEYDGSSPELHFNCKSSWSPRPNNDFMREPPDGCEKIKIVDESRNNSPTTEGQPILVFPLISSGELKLSEDSAFYPLRPIKILQQSVVSRSPPFLEEAK